MRLLFRTEGSSKIGLGHLVRSLALADMVAPLFKIVFYTNEDAPASFIDSLVSRKYDYHFVTNEEFLSQVKDNEGVVLDGYNYGSDIQLALKKKGAITFCIDDVHDKFFHVDVIINQALGISPADYEAANYTKFLLGPRYAILRKEFLQPREKKARAGFKPFICFGGADIYNLSKHVLELIDRRFEFEGINMVVGGGYQHIDELKQVVRDCRNKVALYHDIDPVELSGIMKSSDMAIVPASSILLETLSLGMSVVAGYFTGNQEDIYKGYLASGLVIGAGDFKNDDLIIAGINELRTPGRVEELDKVTSEYFDGRSPVRIRKEFVKAFSTRCLNLRPAVKEDAAILFEWANETQVRANSLNSEPIKWDNHVSWLNSRLASDTTFIYIMKWNGEPVGQVRYDDAGEFLDIDYSISAAFRGVGLGDIIIAHSLPIARKHLSPGKLVRAIVKDANKPSLKVFINNNFNHAGNSDGNTYFTIDPNEQLAEKK